MDDRIDVPVEQLTRLLDEVLQTSGFGCRCRTTQVYIARCPDEEGCNWSVGVTDGASEIAPIIHQLRRLYNVQPHS